MENDVREIKVLSGISLSERIEAKIRKAKTIFEQIPSDFKEKYGIKFHTRDIWNEAGQTVGRQAIIKINKPMIISIIDPIDTEKVPFFTIYSGHGFVTLTPTLEPSITLEMS